MVLLLWFPALLKSILHKQPNWFFFSNQITSKFCWKPFISPQGYSTKSLSLYSQDPWLCLWPSSHLTHQILFCPLAQPSPISSPSLMPIAFYTFRQGWECIQLPQMNGAFPIEVSESNSTWLAGETGCYWDIKGPRGFRHHIYSFTAQEDGSSPSGAF